MCFNLANVKEALKMGRYLKCLIPYMINTSMTFSLNME